MEVSEQEKNRRRRLIRLHYRVENNHNIAGIMDTFSEKGEMIYNGTPFDDENSIMGAHLLIGFGENTPGAFEEIHNSIDQEHFSENEIIIEGRLCGKHVGEFQGFPATHRKVELPFVGFYHFDEDDKLISERVTMNLGPLLPDSP